MGDIAKLVVIMLSFAHFLACGWYAMGLAESNGDNWLDHFGFGGKDMGFRYVISLRWALAQFSGGMDEITPVGFDEHVYAACISVFAFWSCTVFLGVLTSHMTQLYILGNQLNQRLCVMHRFLDAHSISKSLRLRIARNAQHTLRTRLRETPEEALGLMELVSQPLRIELHFEMHYPLLGRHPFFESFRR